MPMRTIRRAPVQINGYSLIELLTVVLIGSVLMIGTATLLITHIRASAKMEATMRLQEAWSRVQFLLDQEIREARVESNSPSTVNCSSLTLKIPNPSGGSDGSVVYSKTSDNTLTRSGPAVNADGTLDFSSSSDTATVIKGVTSFCPNVSAGRVSYSMTLSDVTGVSYQNKSQPSGARSSARIID